jgi:acetoacetate decarboxylase
MPITDDMAMAMGREICGLPKKMADIQITDNGKCFKGTIKRNNITFFTLEGDISGKINETDGETVINQNIGKGVPMYNFKYSKAVDGTGFDLLPTLVRQELTYQNTVKTLAQCQVDIHESAHDPWIELEIVRLLGGVYTVGDNTLQKGENLGVINPMEYVPFSFNKWDWWGK